MPYDQSTHHDYSAASCAFAQAELTDARRAVETIRALFPTLRGGFEAADKRCCMPLVTDDLADVLDRIEEELGA